MELDFKIPISHFSFVPRNFSRYITRGLVPYPINPCKSDRHLISPNHNTAESFGRIMRIKEMITNPTTFDCQTNSPLQYQRKCVRNSMENMDTDVRVLRVNLNKTRG